MYGLTLIQYNELISALKERICWPGLIKSQSFPQYRGYGSAPGSVEHHYGEVDFGGYSMFGLAAVAGCRWPRAVSLPKTTSGPLVVYAEHVPNIQD